MAHQPNLFPPNPSDRPEAQSQQELAAARRTARGHDSAVRPAHASAGRSWMTRVEFMIRILVRLYLGLLVMALPWLTFWTQNNLFTYDPMLLTLASSGFVRGVVSGLGLLNIVLAVREAKNVRAFF